MAFVGPSAKVDHAAGEESTPKNHVSVDDLVKLWERDEKGKQALEEGRAWVAETFYKDHGPLDAVGSPFRPSRRRPGSWLRGRRRRG